MDWKPQFLSSKLCRCSRHLEQVLAHAEGQLAARRRATSDRSAPDLQKVSQTRRAPASLDNIRPVAVVAKICARRGDLVDVILRHVFAAAANHVVNNRNGLRRLALIALGGYGRRRTESVQRRRCDVACTRNGVGKYFERTTSQVMASKSSICSGTSDSRWATPRARSKKRSPQANADMLTKTAMLESRSWSGDRDLEQKFRRSISGQMRCRLRTRVRRAAHARSGGATRKIRRQRLHAGAEPQRAAAAVCATTRICFG